MTLTVKLLLVAALVLGIIIPFGYFLKGERSKKRYKRALGAISEDSSALGKSLIFVGLAEGVCLYGLIISFMILGKL